MTGERSSSGAFGALASTVSALVLTAGGAAAIADATPPVVPLSQERTVFVSANAFDDTSGDDESGHDAAGDFGRFISSVGATAEVPSGFGSCSAYQDSTIAGEGILARGNTGYGIYLGAATASVTASSVVQVTFTLTRASDYTLGGTLDGYAGFAGLTLEGPAGAVHELSAFFETRAVDESGSLPNGQYSLRVHSRIEDGGLGPIQLQGGSTYEIALDFGSGGLGDAGGALPHPLEVAKLPGDRVRLTWAPSCRPGDDDYAVYEGPPGDPFGWLPVTCSTGGWRSYDFEPTLAAAAFLVVPTDGVTEGSYGETSRGEERSPSAAACRPQILGVPICP